jgi:hypothetical protein
MLLKYFIKHKNTGLKKQFFINGKHWQMPFQNSKMLINVLIYLLMIVYDKLFQYLDKIS